MLEPKIDSLIVYKGLPGKVVSIDKKIDIKLADGTSKKVRDKDFITIHKGPVKSLNISDMDCDIKEVWTLLQGEEFNLTELSEFLFEDDSPEALYNAYKFVEEGLYFTGELDVLSCTSQEFVTDILEKEEQKNLKDKLFNDSISRLKKNTWTDDDIDALKEIEGIALEQRSNSKILKALNIKELPLDAHRFLIKINYWDIYKNPFPGRMGISLKSTQKESEYPEVINPMDLTHLSSYAIDDEGSTDPDDAISLDGNKLWVHITDVASLIKNNTPEDRDAASKGSNLYLPTETVHMLPKEVTDIQSLGDPNGNNTLSYCIEFDDDYNIVNRGVHLTRILVTRLTYSYVEENKESDNFKAFYSLANILKKRREDAGAISVSLPEVKIRVSEDNKIDIKSIHGIESRNVVSEFMLLAGETAAIFCHSNNIPIPYASQLPPDASGKPDDNLASMFLWRRKFKRGETKYSPEPHAGLGLSIYTRATSPLRRYTDLVVNQQIRSFLTDEPLLTEEDVLLKVSPSIESLKRMAICERSSNQHWKLVYLSLNKDQVFNGTFVEKKDKGQGVFLIEDLALETVVSCKEFPELNSIIKLKPKKVDVPGHLVTFATC